MLKISPYLSAAPVAKPYSSIEEIIHDGRLSYKDKTRLLDRLADDMNNGRQMRNGMFFNYSRSRATMQQI